MSYEGGGGISPFKPPSKTTGAEATKQFRGSTGDIWRRFFIISPAIMSDIAKKMGTPQMIMTNSLRVSSK